MPAATVQRKRFLGLNNVSDPLRLKLGWLQHADNVDITDTGALVRRPGYSYVLPAVLTGAYATTDFSRFYLVDNGTLKRVEPDLSLIDIRTGLNAAPMQWAEVNDDVYFTNGVDTGIITEAGEFKEWAWPIPTMPSLAAVSGTLPAGVYQVVCTFVLADGRETGASDAAAIYLDGTQALQINAVPHAAGALTQVYIAPADSTVFQLSHPDCLQTSVSWNSSPDALLADLTTQHHYPIPLGCSYITFWQGQIYAAQYLIESDQTIVWISEPLGYHLFDRSSGFFIIQEKVTMLTAHPDGLLIGSEECIYAYNGSTLEKLANYGVVPGWGAVFDTEEQQTLFWSKRGLCTALPLTNITAGQISVECGLSAGAAIIQKDGAKKYVVALQRGGAAFNKRGSI